LVYSSTLRLSLLFYFFNILNYLAKQYKFETWVTFISTDEPRYVRCAKMMPVFSLISAGNSLTSRTSQFFDG
jgi:hypothetical protein